MERLGAAQAAGLQRLRAARALAGEVPDAAVVVALGVARRAGQEAARVRVEDQVAGVLAADRRERDGVVVAGQRQHRRLARLDDDLARPSNATAIGSPTVWGTDGSGTPQVDRRRLRRRAARSASSRPGGAVPLAPAAPVPPVANYPARPSGVPPTKPARRGRACRRACSRSWSSVTLPVSETNTRVRSGWVSPGDRVRRVAGRDEGDALRVRARSPCRPPAPCRPSPVRSGRVPSDDTIVTAGWTMPLHASGPP